MSIGTSAKPLRERLSIGIHITGGIAIILLCAALLALTGFISLQVITTRVQALTPATLPAMQSELNNVLALAQIALGLTFALTLGVGATIAWISTHHVVDPLNKLIHAVRQIEGGQFDYTLTTTGLAREQVAVADAFTRMSFGLQELLSTLEQRVAERTAELEGRATELSAAKELAERTSAEAESAKRAAEDATRTMEQQMWLAAAQAALSDKLRGEQDAASLADQVLQQLCQTLTAPIGLLYLMDDADTLQLIGSYAFMRRKHDTNSFKRGEALVGQAALEEKVLIINHVPDGYIPISSGLGATAPRQLIIAPYMYDGRVIGVIELGALLPFSAQQERFLRVALDHIAIAFNTAQARARINVLLIQTQQQTEAMQVQEEELRVTNTELQTQAAHLRTSETRLKEKQSELEAINTELEENSSALHEKQTVLDQQNRALIETQAELERRAAELALASKYKSEFLANMSHELRTPLNSLLILARLLAENEERTLTAEQVHSATIIYNSGTDLLTLINDILDLSKVEAGKMEFHLEPVPLTELVTAMRTQFTHVAAEKQLDFTCTIALDAPADLYTDGLRMKQVVKNLIANAFKFTESGCVTVHIQLAPHPHPLGAVPALAISVTDTGIGIAAEKQRAVFEAFQQADGSTSRRYGGTGLGLAISRELAAKLHGALTLHSVPGAGSTFTLILPLAPPPAVPSAEAEEPAPEPAPLVVSTGTRTAPALIAPTGASPAPAPAATMRDDRSVLGPYDKRVLVIEDDLNFAQIVRDFSHKRGLKCLLAHTGQAGLDLVHRYKPHAIVLDLNLPDMSGWEVLEALKHDPDTRHIPVHVMSVEDQTVEAYKRGVMGFLTKPINASTLDQAFVHIEEFIAKKIATLLVVEDDAGLRHSVGKLLGGMDIQISEAASGQAALAALRAHTFDCMILDLTLPDMSGFALLDQLHADPQITQCPIIVYTGQELSEDENRRLMQYTNSVIIKGAKSPERLLDEAALFLHRVVADMPEEKRQTIKRLYDHDLQLAGKTVLIVDDDMRNSYALSRLLSDKGLLVEIAANGQKALDLLALKPSIDIVLMDVMMPVLDGFETIKRIRAQARFQNLPILALTAKAMQGDREKCLAAGANDYLSKPVDVQRLFSMLRVWLYQ